MSIGTIMAEGRTEALEAQVKELQSKLDSWAKDYNSIAAKLDVAEREANTWHTRAEAHRAAAEAAEKGAKTAESRLDKRERECQQWMESYEMADRERSALLDERAAFAGRVQDDFRTLLNHFEPGLLRGSPTAGANFTGHFRRMINKVTERSTAVETHKTMGLMGCPGTGRTVPIPDPTLYGGTAWRVSETLTLNDGEEPEQAWIRWMATGAVRVVSE